MSHLSFLDRSRMSRAANEPRRFRRLLLESLEARCLLAANPVFMNDNWHLWQDSDGSNSLTVGDLVRNDNDPLAPGTITATYGVNAFGLVTSGLPGPQLPASLPAHRELQQAINGTQAAGTLHVLPGWYTPAATLIIGQPLTLLGPQAGVDPRFSRFAGDSTEAVISGAEFGLSTVLRIAANDVRLDGLEFRDASGDLIDSSEGANITGPTIQNNLIHYVYMAGDDAIQLRDTTGALIQNNRIYDTSGDAITLTGANGATIRDNDVFNVYSFDGAIYVFGSTNTTIQGNRVSDVHNNDGIKIGSNTGADAAKSGGAILNNEVSHVFNGGDGIAVYSSDVEVRGNKVFNIQSVHGAISVRFPVDNVSVVENFVYFEDRASAPPVAHQIVGIKLGRINAPATFVAIKDNRVQDYDVGIAVEGGAALIENNVLTSNFVGVRIFSGALVDLGSISDPGDGNSNPTGRSAGSDVDGSSDGRNVLAGYRGVNGNYAIENLNRAGEGHPNVTAEGNRFGTLQLSNIEQMVYDAVDNPSLTTVDYDPPGTGLIIIDNGELGYAESGQWLSSPGGLNGNQQTSAAGTGQDVATWTFSGLPTGIYRVSATWAPGAAAATNSPFRVLDSSRVLQTVPVDQTSAPNDFTETATPWEDLGGPYSIISGTLTVRLTNAANGFVLADAVRIERLGALTSPPWQNPNNRMDVNDDGLVTALDVLMLINAVNRHGVGLLPLPAPAPDLPPPFLDVNGDDRLTPQDVLNVINYLNQRVSGEGESWWPAEPPRLVTANQVSPATPSALPLEPAAGAPWPSDSRLASDPGSFSGPGSTPESLADLALADLLGWDDLLTELAVA